MGFELGQLLGDYGGGQSFENVGSWSHVTHSGSSSFAIDSSDVHSSDNTARLWRTDTGSHTLTYDYGVDGDLWDKWSPDITSHRIVCYFWGMIEEINNSGDIAAIIHDAAVHIPRASNVARHRMETIITSGDAATLRFDTTTHKAASGVFNCRIDDVLTTVDMLDLYPDRSLVDNREITVSRHSTLGGREASYKWGEWNGWQVSLKFLPASEANLLDIWWRDNRPLLWVPDTSDSTQMHIVQMVNAVSPVTTLQRPYQDLKNVSLMLETVQGGLIF